MRVRLRRRLWQKHTNPLDSAALHQARSRYNILSVSTEPIRILFCDYDGEFKFGDVLSRLGYAIDQIRPDALRQVTVGDHQVYVFAFVNNDNMQKALRTCEKLKQANLPTPILMLNHAAATPEYLNHKVSANPADGYVANPTSEYHVLDALDLLVGCPVPVALKGSLHFVREEQEIRNALENYKQQVTELERKIGELEAVRNQDKESMDKALEAQRNFYKPKLKALLEDQKIQVQSETERLKFELSEVQAKLLDREMKVRKLEVDAQEAEKSKAKLREFYMTKLKALEQEKNSKG